MVMKIDVVTIFPEMLAGYFYGSIMGRSVDKGLVEINLVDLRNYCRDRHRQVDDTPYGGGRGMILKPEPLFSAVEDLRQSDGDKGSRVILLSPQGQVFSQGKARELTGESHLILLCGRYEGIDERVRLSLVDEEISIGDFVLTGGELAAAVIVDAVVRLLPGVLDEEVSRDESFSASLLEHPQYTRPAVFRDMEVPPVLLSGHHKEIASWRRRRSLKRTFECRPDLLIRAELKPSDRVYLQELQNRVRNAPGSGTCNSD